MRRITRIVVHCTATREGADYSAADIDRWHEARGWSGIGYHAVVRLDGTIEPGRPEDKIGAHVAGYNSDSLGIVYVGGCQSDGKTPKDTRTIAQRAALLRQVREWMERHQIPVASVVGHYELDTLKACPSFSMPNFRRDLQGAIAPKPAAAVGGPATLAPLLRPPYPDSILAQLVRAALGADTLADAVHRVAEVQEAAGLVPDGIVGAKTWPVLIDHIGAERAALLHPRA